MVPMIGWIALAIALVLNASANALLKAGSASISSGVGKASLLAAATNPFLVGGIVLFALNVLCYTFALSKLPLSLAYPAMVIGGLLIVTTASVLIFGESLSYLQVGGLALIVFGVALLYL
jgi:small multidrug resistance pump